MWSYFFLFSESSKHIKKKYCCLLMLSKPF